MALSNKSVAWIAVGMTVLLVLVIAGIPDAEEQVTKTRTDETTDTTSAATATSDTTASTEEEAGPQPLETDWQFQHGTDEMSDKTWRIAATTSTNEIDFDFPYEGGTTFDLVVRHRDGSTDAYISCSSCQFLASPVGDDRIEVRVDDNSPRNYAIVPPEDYDSETIFIRNAQRFISSLRGADELKVRASFYEAGSRIMRFNVTNLNWTPQGPIKPYSE